MIREFRVQNYCSINGEQVLNFVAKGPESELVARVADGSYIYKLGVFLGPNASGKSNMLFALEEVFRLLVVPKSDASKEIGSYCPFALNKIQPTQMFISFYADGTRYDYEVTYDKKHILNEKLYYYPNGSKSLFYERIFNREDLQADIKFGGSLHLQVKTQESIRENTLNNHSVLSVCAKNTFKEDIEPFSKLYKWIMDNYHDVDSDYDDSRGIVEVLKEAYEDGKKHKFYNQMLKKADLNIKDFHPMIEDRTISQELREYIEKQNIPDSVKEEMLRPVIESVAFVNNSESGSFDVPLNFQSKGTLKYIRILNMLYDLISGNHVYYIDELGEDLHYDLLLFYLNVFLYNSDQSQLLITSQETALLAQDLINENRGVVWIVEKNHRTASSEYSRGDSFGLHKNLSFYNSYRIGRLGAKPELGSIFIDLEK